MQFNLYSQYLSSFSIYQQIFFQHAAPDMYGDVKFPAYEYENISLERVSLDILLGPLCDGCKCGTVETLDLGYRSISVTVGCDAVDPLMWPLI